MPKETVRRPSSTPQRNGHERIVEEVREQERRAIEKAMDIAIRIYAPAFKELEKY